MPVGALDGAPLFEGLDQGELAEVASVMRFRSFEAGATICREGDPSESMFVIVEGLVHLRVASLDDPGMRARSFFAEGRLAGKLRYGDVIGATSLVTGEPRSATATASVATGALELGRGDFVALIGRFPRILENLVRILGRRLAEASSRQALAGSRGEAVALISGPSLAHAVPEVVSATRAAGARAVEALDAGRSLAEALGRLDGLLHDHGTVLLLAGLEDDELPLLLDQVDRAVALVGDPGEGERLAALASDPHVAGQRLEVALAEGVAAPARLGTAAPDEATSVICTLRLGADGSVAGERIAWLGRHLSRTKLGLALGAGGAKGYAHVGALYALEEAGYTVDYVGGSSIGAIVGAYLAMGMDAAQIERTLRDAFTPETVAETLKISMSGAATGLDAMVRLLRATTRERSFTDLAIPLVVMTVDLTDRKPAPLREGTLWEALVAATALAGLFPPQERDGHRLVDGLALVPVPTGAVADDGADVVVSVNLMSRDTLPAWPGHAPVPDRPRRRGSRMLDTLLEVMDLAQLDESVRHAGLADVVVTPRFGPGSWRDFHLADLFLAAGRESAERELPALRALASPQLASVTD